MAKEKIRIPSFEEIRTRENIKKKTLEPKMLVLKDIKEVMAIVIKQFELGYHKKAETMLRGWYAELEREDST